MGCKTSISVFCVKHKCNTLLFSLATFLANFWSDNSFPQNSLKKYNGDEEKFVDVTCCKYLKCIYPFKANKNLMPRCLIKN